MKKLAILAVAVAALSGCATGHQSYSDAHESASKRGIEEAKARAESEKNLALAMASAAQKCATDSCVMGLSAMLMISRAKNDAVAAAAPIIERPVNEFLEWTKVIAPVALGGYNSYLGAITGLVNSTRGAADKDVATQGIGAITPVLRNQQ